MKILLDTDMFCKLAAAGMLEDAVRLLGASLTECARLPALPYMLRKGQLRKLFGPEICDGLMPIANTIPVLVQSSEEWLDRLTPIDAIDIGEAQIFAAAAEHRIFVMSGDKRALRALKDVDGFPDALAGRIIVLEGILITLCEDLGADEVRQRVLPLITTDQVVKICFSNPNSDPSDCLRSYFEQFAIELVPLVLWKYWSGGAA